MAEGSSMEAVTTVADLLERAAVQHGERGRVELAVRLLTSADVVRALIR